MRNTGRGRGTRGRRGRSGGRGRLNRNASFKKKKIFLEIKINKKNMSSILTHFPSNSMHCMLVQKKE